MLISAAAAAAITVLAAVFYSFAMAAVVAGVAAVTNALGKVSLDAIIQREVPDSLRASAFARSETLLQLAWVVGGAFGIALPADRLARLHRRRGAARARRRAWSCGACTAAPRGPSAGRLARGARRPRWAVVVVSRSRVRPAARSSWPAAAGEPAGPDDVEVEVGAQEVAVRPVQYCLDGEGQRYDSTSRRSSRSPRTPPSA